MASKLCTNFKINLICFSGVVFINVYDFDNTIYKGESFFGFYFFCAKHHPRLYKYSFVAVKCVLMYKMCRITEEGLMDICKQYGQLFIKECPDAAELAEKYWQKNFKKIKSFYHEMKRPDDIIISASFNFLLEPCMRRLGIKNVVCTNVDLEKGEITSLCFRKNKKILFDELFGCKIDNFYTDSLNDVPLLRCAENGYIVKGNKITKWSE
ncbi:MAG: hypothetical protein E7600_06445 [Ruminococcaceae bacterium]|nr:hypothetical protein [Oscillospiraceae bacterium]